MLQAMLKDRHNPQLDSGAVVHNPAQTVASRTAREAVQPPPLAAAAVFIQDIAEASHRPLKPASTPPRGIVVLYSETDKLGKAPPEEIWADLETIAVAKAVAQVLRQHTPLEVHLAPALRHVERVLAPFPPEDYVVFNLFEGVDGIVPEDGNDLLDEEARAALTIEALGYRYTGADGRAMALSVNKAWTKEALVRAGVLTPSWRAFERAEDVTPASTAGMCFPLIVKPLCEDSSLGIDADAVVSGADTLQSRVAQISLRYEQPVLVEEFIIGREFNVGVWGDPPQVLPLAEVDLSALGAPEKRIVTYAAKWQEGSFEYEHTPVACPAVVSDALAARIRSAALQAWAAIGSRRGYGRVDMRVYGKRCYVLEVNPNPSIAADAGLARAARAAGLDFAHMILTILSSAGVDLHDYDTTG